MTPQPHEDVIAPNIGALLNPAHICIVGARDGDGSWPDRIYGNLKRFGFGGQIYPVNPRRDLVWDEKAYPDLVSVPDQPDHALIVIPSKFAVEAVADTLASGARTATILSGGFSPEQLADIRAMVRGTGFALSGPNCLGNISAPAKLITTTDTRLDELTDGPVAVVGQSGGIVMSLNRALTSRGIGARYVVSSGNEICLTTADYMNHFADVDGVRVVLAFVESVRDWARFEAACRYLRSRGKYLVALKVGQAAASRNAAASHAGAMAGSYAAFEAASSRLGVITVDTMESAVEAFEFLSRAPAPQGTSVGAVTISGGVSELLLDGAERTKVTFATLAPGTRNALAARVDEGPVSNPMDTGFAGISSVQVLVDCVEAMAEDPAVDVIMLQEELLGREEPKKEAALKILNDSLPAGTAGTVSKPVVLFSISTVYVSEHGRRLRAKYPNLAFLQGIDKTLGTLRAIGSAEDRYRRFGEGAPKETGVTARESRTIVPAEPGTSELNETESLELLADYGFVPPPGGMAVTIPEVLETAASLTFPVVLKLVSRKVLHESDVGGVILDISSLEELERACHRLESQFPDLEGYLVTHQLSSERVEVVLGYVKDPEVGPIVAVGRAGVETEVSNDIVIVPVPCSPQEALQAIEGTNLGTMLGAWRGREACDIDAVVSAICNMSRLADDLSEQVKSAEVNPLAVVPGQSGAWALDALVELEGAK